MDQALRKKMDTYTADVLLGELMTETGSPGNGESTLIKADISLFHEVSPLSAPKIDALPVPLSDYDRGLQDGLAKSGTVYQDTIKVMQSALDGLQRELGAMAKQIEEGYLSAVLEGLRTVFPALMQGGTDLELRAILQDVLGSVLKGQIQLSVHPEDRKHCEELCAGTDIAIITDGSLSRQQMQFSWTDGGAEINCKATADLFLEHLEAASQHLRGTLHG